MSRFAKQTTRAGSILPYAVAGALLLVVGVVSFAKPSQSTFQALTSISLGSSTSAATVKITDKVECDTPVVGTPWPGTIPMELPTQASYERVQANPKLAESNAAALAEEFAAAPWLLPPRTKAFNYAGVHDLDKLLELRSTPVGKYNKTVTLLTFSKKFAVMTQNTLYSMTKFAGVRNYIVGTWEKEDLDACADLNLPCADVTSFLPEPMDHGPNAGVFGTHDYLVICWLRPPIILHMLKKGFAVMNTDSDIVYTVKPAWESYLDYLEKATADAAFQAEYGAVNGGNYVILPTNAGIGLFENWTAMAVDGIKEGHHDQQRFDRMVDKRYRRCTWGAKHCQTLRAEMERNNQTEYMALIRAFMPGFWMYSEDICTLMRVENAPLFDTCDWSILFLHPVCTDYAGKLRIFKQQKLWFFDDDGCKKQNGSVTDVLACEPIRWLQPNYELHLYSCPSYPLALGHERPPLPKLRGNGTGGASSAGPAFPLRQPGAIAALGSDAADGVLARLESVAKRVEAAAAAAEKAAAAVGQKAAE